MYSNAQKFIYKLAKINREKVLWYKLSIIVLAGIFFIIVDYDYIIQYKLERYFIFAGLAMSAIWWYWTMGVLSTLLRIKNLQIEMLDDILYTIKEIKKDVKDS